MSEDQGIQHSAAFWTTVSEQMAIKAAETLNRIIAAGMSDAEALEALSLANLYTSAVNAFSHLAIAIKASGLKPRDGMPEVKLPTFDPRNYDNPRGPWMN